MFGATAIYDLWLVADKQSFHLHQFLVLKNNDKIISQAKKTMATKKAKTLMVMGKLNVINLHSACALATYDRSS